MDDYDVSSLSESKNEWGARLVNILTPSVIEGIKSIFTEADKLCRENEEEEKYLMTFQNLLARVAKWNSAIIDEETKRIMTTSQCEYLEDLVTCLVMFAWLSNQTYFKELTDQDIRARLVDEQSKMMEQDMAPFGFIDDGLEDQESFKDPYGTTWSPVKVKRGW